MTDERFRSELNQVFADMAGSPSSNLRDRVRRTITTVPERRGPYWIAAVAAAAIATLIVAVLIVAGPLKSGQSPVGVPKSTPSTSPAPVSYMCVTQDFVMKSITPASAAPLVVFVSALRVESHPGYDRLTIEFANGLPQDVQVSAPFDGTQFTLSPSGLPVTLKGSKGIVVTIHGADLHTSYSGSTDIITGDPTIAEVRRVQDFEGVVQLGLGVNGSGCSHVTFLHGPDRLVIDVQSGS